MLRWARKLAWVVGPLALAGEVGHRLLDGMGQVLAHHLFHIVFAGGAATVFVVWLLRDIRAHGRPRFTWRLRPETAPRPGAGPRRAGART